MTTKQQTGILLPNEDWLKDHDCSYRVTTDGEVEVITPKNGEHYTLEEMYEYCNTDIVQFLYLPENRIMVCDEEAALKGGRRQNWIATKIVADVVDAMPMNLCLEYFIYGNVMIVKDDEIE